MVAKKPDQYLLTNGLFFISKKYICLMNIPLQQFQGPFHFIGCMENALHLYVHQYTITNREKDILKNKRRGAS